MAGIMNSLAPKATDKPIVQAAKEALATAFIVFMLTILMVGFKTEANQGQPLTFVVRFGAVGWAVALVPIGRFLLALDRCGISRPAVYGGLAGFLYMFGGAAHAIATGAIGTSSDTSGAIVNTIQGGLPLPFGDPIVNAILGLGALYVAVKALMTQRLAARGQWSMADREDREDRLSYWARRASSILGPILVVLAFALPFMPLEDNVLKAHVATFTLILIYVMLGWGLNIVVGLAGLLDLGYVAFYAVGAYSYAKLSLEFGLDFWASLPLAGLFAAFFGVILGFPVLRLRGDYLAIVTLGFGEMMRKVLENWQDFTGGPAGIGGILRITFFGVPFERNPEPGTHSFHTLFGIEFSTLHRIVFLYYVILFLALVTSFVTVRLRKLPIGRAWEALREDETACRALGINSTNTKLTAFAIGAMFAGFAGSFFAVNQLFISPESFVFIESAVILAIVVLGGMGSQVGVALAAILLIGLPEFMRELSLFRMLVFGAVMVLIMLWRPKGLLAYREPTILLKPRAGRKARQQTVAGEQ